MFGDEYHVRAAREPAVGRYPARVAAHHLDDHHAVVRLRGRVQAVYGLHDGVDSRVEAEGEVRAVEVVVNRLRYADEVESVLVPHVARGAQGSFAAADDERVHSYALPSLKYAPRKVVAVVRVCARGAEDRAAAREYARDGEAVERPPVVFDEPAPAVLYAEDFRALLQHRAAHDGAYDRVEAGAVAASRHDSDTQTHSRKTPSNVQYETVN